jgi:hypothetical protein
MNKKTSAFIFGLSLLLNLSTNTFDIKGQNCLGSFRMCTHNDLVVGLSGYLGLNFGLTSSVTLPYFYTKVGLSWYSIAGLTASYVVYRTYQTLSSEQTNPQESDGIKSTEMTQTK